MSEEEKDFLEITLDYLKKEDDTRRIKCLTIFEAELLLKYIQQKESIIKEVREYILQHCEIIRFENENVDKVGKVDGIPLLEILDKENK